MRILILNTDYPAFLEYLYSRDPALRERPYAEQMRIRMESLFGVADYYSRNLRRLGHEAWDVHVNNPWLQQAWAREQALAVPPPLALRWRLRRGLIPWASRTHNPEHATAVLHAQIRHYRPDVILNQDILAIPAAPLKALLGAGLLVGQHAATPLPPAARLRAYDFMISSFPYTIERLQGLDIPAFLNRMGFEPGVLDGLGPPDRDYPLTFVGGLSPDLYSSRIDLLEAVCREVPELKVWGPGIRYLRPRSPLRQAYQGPAWGRDALGILQASRITLNHHGNVPPHANNMRLYEATAVGTLLLTDHKPDLNKIFEPGREVAAYRDAENCVRLIRHYLTHEDERKAVASAGRERTLREHTYFHRMEELAGILETRRVIP